MKIIKIGCLLLIICLASTFCCGCGMFPKPEPEPKLEPGLEQIYTLRTLNQLTPSQDWQLYLKDIADELVRRYRVECNEITDYESTLVIGRFALYATETADNYVCFSGDIRIFRYNDQALCWETNHYGADFKSSKNLGRSDFIKVGTHISDITFSIPENKWALLGTPYAGVSSYWDYNCKDFTVKDILETETWGDLWNSRSAVSNEDWYYKQSGETYWTYSLNGVIIK